MRPLIRKNLPAMSSVILRSTMLGSWGLMALGSLSIIHADDRFPPYDNTEEVKAYWASRPDFFQYKTHADLPPDLQWENGQELPDIGDPAAKKGGTFHLYIESFPPTFRTNGPDGNNSFRGEHHDDILLGLVSRHPNVEGWIPALAESWAVASDRKTVYFKLDPSATWSDGEKVTVEDFFMTFYVMLSPHLNDPWYQDFYSKEFKQIVKYDDQTLSLTLSEPKPDPLWYASLSPTSQKFFREFKDDFPARYQWRKSPTTGAYDILPSGVERGRKIKMTRVKNWWAKDKKFYRYRYNPDVIEYRVVANTDKAFELFRQGQIDFFGGGTPTYWYDKSEIEPFFKGYIERGVFYNIYPRVSRGVYLNVSQPGLDNLETRLGINYALNFQKVIDVILRGDAVRMQSTVAGFGQYTSPHLKARPYDVAKAQEHFFKAGYTQRGADGVLMKADGQRLSFTLSAAQTPIFVQVCLMLKEEALKAGLELKVEAMEPTQLYKKVDQKAHEMGFMGWAASPPYPRFWEYYHSVNAWKVEADGTKKIVPDTNNVTMMADPELDSLIDQHRQAQTEEEVKRLSWQLAEMIEARACSIPAWEAPFYRYMHWRWMCFPQDGNVRASQDPLQSHVFWIDEEKKNETQKAIRAGESFGEVLRIHDQYREQ